MKIRSNTPKESIFKKIGKILTGRLMGIFLIIFYVSLGITIYNMAGNVIVIWILGLLMMFTVMFTIIEEIGAIFGILLAAILLIPLFANVDKEYDKNEINVHIKNIKLSPSNNKLIIYLKDNNPSMLVVDMDDYATDFYKIEQLENDDFKPTIILTETILKDVYDVLGLSDSFIYHYNIQFSMNKGELQNEIFSKYYYENDNYSFNKRKFLNNRDIK